MELVLHPQTRAQVTQFIDEPTHALLLEGAKGSGKKTLIKHIASQILSISADTTASHPYISVIVPEKNAISIERVRQTREFLRLRVPSKQQIARIIMVFEIDTMSHEAQNAFLKMLEEPPNDTLILMTTSDEKKLLTTVHSRVRHLSVLPVTQQEASKYFTQQGFSANDITKAYHMADGRIGLTSALLADDTNHPLVEAITEAKRLLSSTPFERLARVDQLVKQREDLPTLFEALERVTHAALYAASRKEASTQVARWKNRLKRILTSQDQLAKNASAKLLLTDLMLNL